MRAGLHALVEMSVIRSFCTLGWLPLAVIAASASALTPPHPDRELTDVARAEGNAWLAIVDGMPPRGVWRKVGEGPWREVLEIDAASPLQRVKPGTWRLRTPAGAVISTDDGLTWAATTAPWSYGVSDDRGHLFLCSGRRLQRSDDAGVSWSDVAIWGSASPPNNCHATASAGRLAVVGVWPAPATGVAAPIDIVVSTDGGQHWSRRKMAADGALLDALSKPDALLMDGDGNLFVVREAIDIAPDGRLSNRRAWFLLPATDNRWQPVERALPVGELLSAVGGDAYGLHVNCSWNADKSFGSDLCLLSADGAARLEVSAPGRSGLSFRTLPGGEVLPVPTVDYPGGLRSGGSSEMTWFDRRDHRWHVLSTVGLPSLEP